MCLIPHPQRIVWAVVKRREFIALLSSTVAFWRALSPIAARAQYQMPPPYPPPAYPPADAAAATAGAGRGTADNSVGQVATVQGSATVTRANAAAAVLQVSDPIFKEDTLETGANSAARRHLRRRNDVQPVRRYAHRRQRLRLSGWRQRQRRLGQCRDRHGCFCREPRRQDWQHDHHDAGSRDRHSRHHRRGRGAGGGGTAAPTVKLYPDADGHVGQIDLFDRQGNRLGALTQGASAFTIRRGAGGRLIAQPYRIPPQEAARDRGVLQRLNVTHTIGRQMINQRRQLRGPNRQGPNNQRGQGGPQNFRPGGQQNFPAQRSAEFPARGDKQNPRPGGPFNRPPGGPGRPRPRGPKNDNRNR